MSKLKPCLSLEAAIEHAKERAAKLGDCLCAAEHAQLAEWLEELVDRRAQPDNEPLALEELRGMNGEPVWVETMQEWRTVYIGIENDIRLYSILNTISARHVLDNGGRIYRRKPEPKGGDPNADSK